MRELLLVACLVLITAACDGPDTTVDSATSTTTEPVTSSDDNGSDNTRQVWEGTWSKAETSLEPSELDPRLHVIGDDALIIHEQNRGTTVEGEIYDPDSGEATRIAASRLVWRASSSMAWTGSELLVVGGSNGPGIEQIGAAYSPTDDSWRPLPDPPGPVDAWENAITGQAVWTGSEMLIYSEGLAFDPATSSWRNIAPPPGPPRATEVAVWTGSELILWGGCDATEPQCDDLVTGLLTDGLVYDPATDGWRRTAMSPLSAGVHPQGVWSGEQMLIYGGGVSDENGVTAAAYDPTNDSWDTIPDPPLFPRRYAAAAWTGRFFVLWGGSGVGTGGGVEYDDGAAYDPVAHEWLKMPETPGFDQRDRHAMAWVQDRLLITGGFETTGPLTFQPDPTD